MKSLFSLIFIILSINITELSFSQTISKVDGLFPTQAVNRKEMIIPIPNSMVRVELNGGLNESTACPVKSIAEEGFRMEISWYNKNDETGKMMWGLVANQSDFENQWVTHKRQMDDIYKFYSPSEGTTCSGVKEEVVRGGKLYIMTSTSNFCDTDDRVKIFVNAKCFFFNGTTTGSIEINCHCKTEEVREMIKSIINNVNDFNFSTLFE